MNPADIAALLYAIVALGEFASRAIQQLKGDQLTDEEFNKAWTAMRQRLADANALWEQSKTVAESHASRADPARPSQG